MQVLIITLFPHPRFGYLLLPFLADFDQKQQVYSITEAATTASSGFCHLNEQEQAIVKLAERYSVKNLMQSYSREKREADFLEHVATSQIEMYIRPFIEKRQRELVEMIVSSPIPVFVREQLKTRHFRAEKALEVLPEPSGMVFIFRNKEKFTYQAKVFNGDSDIPLYDQFYACLVSKPAVVVIGRQLHHFRDVDEKKVRPFIHQWQIEVPARKVESYIRGFVLQCVKNYDTIGEGLSIVETHHHPVAELTLEIDFHLQPVLTLRFHYGKQIFSMNDPSHKKVVELTGEQGQLAVGWFYRDAEWEKKIVSMLIENGLTLTPANQFTVRNVTGHLFCPDGDELVEWINRNGALLSFFSFKQAAAALQYYTGRIELQFHVSDNNDWFDINSMVCFDEFDIPFVRFQQHILDHCRRYLLPDGRIAILPEEWFVRYEEMFRYGKTEENTIRLRHFHFRVKELAEKGCLPVEEWTDAPCSVAPPATLLPILRPYQVKGFRWLVRLHQNGFGGCLADDMGLGKTLQSIALLYWVYADTTGSSPVSGKTARQLSLFEDDLPSEVGIEQQAVRKDIPPSLIVMPTSLIHNWLNEIRRFAPQFVVYPHTGAGRAKDSAFFRLMQHVNIVLTSYGILRQDIDLLRTFPFHYLILDESQQIKNPASLNFLCAKQINASYRLALTGTPIENSLSDLWAQMDFLNEGILGSHGAFKSRFRESGVINAEGEQQRLLKIILPFILRRTKEEVAPELPLLTSETIWCEMNEEQATLYKEEKTKIRNAILEHSPDSRRSLAVTVLGGLTRLRLLANHPAILVPAYNGASAKFEQIIEQAEILFAERHKVLIFSSFVKHLKLLAGYFDERNWSYAWLTGSTTNREAVISRFSSDERIQAFFISLKAGGTGLNLTAADYVFIIDPWWNSSAELQAVSRAHRIGQRKNVTLYRFITKDTIEEKIRRLQQKKTALAEGLIGSHLSREEIEELFS